MNKKELLNIFKQKGKENAIARCRRAVRCRGLTCHKSSTWQEMLNLGEFCTTRGNLVWMTFESLEVMAKDLEALRPNGVMYGE